MRIIALYAPAMLFLFLSILYGISNAHAQEQSQTVYFVAPDGKPENSGSKVSPWDIASALEGQHEVEPSPTKETPCKAIRTQNNEGAEPGGTDHHCWR